MSCNELFGWSPGTLWMWIHSLGYIVNTMHSHSTCEYMRTICCPLPCGLINWQNIESWLKFRIQEIVFFYSASYTRIAHILLLEFWVEVIFKMTIFFSETCSSKAWSSWNTGCQLSQRRWVFLLQSHLKCLLKAPVLNTSLSSWYHCLGGL